ncbi:hypothetical protein OG762_37450 [Streptomyces sp. NBC_01136]|uniref:hypothetical protein n=1 Tax=unclassified Streptomyces TaxID=2593676 RepID=UPI00324B130A|nr:hypothetical protein OG762_37450 [Streptomyces sp. NBC_01136]
MMMTRSTAVTAAVAAAAALAATGITYASAASEPLQAAPAVRQAAPAVGQEAPAQAPFGGSDTGRGNQSKGNESKGNEGREGNEGNEENEGNEGNERKGHEGRIHINERSYSSRPGDCITVVSGLGAKSLNIHNDTRKTVEVFRGAVCDNGAPIALVGPHSSSDGVRPEHTEGIHVEDGVVGSFRVIDRHEGD